MTPFADYQQLLEDLDKVLSAISGASEGSLCPTGCSSCCEAFTLLPVEASVIASRSRPGDFAAAGDGRCPLLTAQGRCSAYAFRPLLCRVRGFPIFSLDSDGKPSCEACGKSRPERACEAARALHLDEWNARLYAVNARFCEENGISPRRLDVQDLYRWSMTAANAAART